MPSLETYRKQAALLVRWHSEANYSVGEKLRLLERFRHVTDREALDLKMPLTLAQEIVAIEAGFDNWAALTDAVIDMPTTEKPATTPCLSGTVPILFVTDVTEAAAYYENKAGFTLDFLHGKPPFYGAVSRDRATLHLRHVQAPNFANLAQQEQSLILATIEVTNIKALFAELHERGAAITQGLVEQAWGGTDFHLRDPDGNVISFVELDHPKE